MKMRLVSDHVKSCVWEALCQALGMRDRDQPIFLAMPQRDRCADAREVEGQLIGPGSGLAHICRRSLAERLLRTGPEIRSVGLHEVVIER